MRMAEVRAEQFAGAVRPSEAMPSKRAEMRRAARQAEKDAAVQRDYERWLRKQGRA
jgi:hypothetical protein